jgi:hypothetical protein
MLADPDVHGVGPPEPANREDDARDAEQRAGDRGEDETATAGDIAHGNVVRRAKRMNIEHSTLNIEC